MHLTFYSKNHIIITMNIANVINNTTERRDRIQKYFKKFIPYWGRGQKRSILGLKCNFLRPPPSFS